MKVSRRSFLKYCTASAAALGLGLGDIQRLEAALASSGAPTLIWLHGSGCQGDSVSFLNLFLDAPAVGHVDTKDILLDHINLAYHTVVMSAAGQTAVTMANQAKRKGGYVLVLEGGVPTAFDGRACIIATDGGQELTYQQAITNLAPGALAVVNVGTCACFGGIPKSGPVEYNPSGIVSCTDFVLDPAHLGLTEKLLINIPGCPSHPDWVAWVVVQLILGNVPDLDEYKRPSALYINDVHENCPRNPDFNPTVKATTFGEDGKCLEALGCRGPGTHADCPSRGWNKGPIPQFGSDQYMRANWCVDSNAMCFGCVEPGFPGGDFYPDPQPE